MDEDITGWHHVMPFRELTSPLYLDNVVKHRVGVFISYCQKR